MYDAATGQMCFSEALAYIKAGRPVGRASWKQAAYVWYVCEEMVLIIPPGSRTADRKSHAIIHWTPSSHDVLAEDWVFIADANTPELEK